LCIGIEFFRRYYIDDDGFRSVRIIQVFREASATILVKVVVCLVLFSVVCNGVPPCLLLLLAVSSLPADKHEDAWCSVFRLLHSISSLTVTVCHRAVRLLVVYSIESDIRTSNRSLYTVIAAFSITSPLIRHTLERAKRFAQRCHEVALFFRIPWARKPKFF